MKNTIKKVIGIILVIILTLYSNVSMANNNTDYSAEESKKKENESKISEIEDRKKKIEDIKDTTLKEVEKLEVEISEYETQIQSLDTKIGETKSKIEETQQKLDKAQKDFDKQDELLKARLIASYEAGETSYLDVLLSSQNITDFISNYYLINEVATYDAELLDQIEKQKKEIAEAKEVLEQSKRDLDTQRSSKQSVSLQLQTSKSNKNKYVSELSDEQKALEAKAEELKKDNQKLDAAISSKKAAIEAWRKQQQQKSSSGSSGSSNSNSNSVYTGSASSAGFIRPVNSYVTTGIYYSSGRYHGAVDFGASGVNGMPVVAVADGYVVSTAAWTTSYGNHILIAHANGLYTLYAHGQAGSICVSQGQTVKKGQQIMRVGSTGNSSGPHLHFEVRTSPGTYSCRVNPAAYLP